MSHILQQGRGATSLSQKRMLSDHVAAFLAAEQTKLIARDPEIHVVDQLEHLLAEGDAPSLQKASKRLSDLKRNPLLTDELSARSAYQANIQVLCSDQPTGKTDALEALAQAAHSYPTTVYGILAGIVIANQPVHHRAE